MKWVLCITWLCLCSCIHAEEESTNPPFGNSGFQQGGSRLYPNLSGVTDYNNRNGYSNYGPGPAPTSYNNVSRYPYQQPGSNQPYPIQWYPYNMSYSGYPGVNNMNYNSRYNQSFSNISNNNRPATQITNPHQPFGYTKPITNPNQPFGSPGVPMSNPYNNKQINTGPYNSMNQNFKQPSYPSNPSYGNSPSYPTNSNYPNNPSHPSGPSYPYNPNFRSNSSYPSNPNNYNHSIHANYPTDPGYNKNSGYRNNDTMYTRQPSTKNDPHRPFGQPPKASGRY